MTDNELRYKGSFGLERETLRVDRFGRLAQTPHPFGDDESITRDFCENQIELITPVCGSINELMESLAALDKRAREELAKNGESIWLYSNPPHFESEEEIPVANFTGRHSSKRSYREQLERRYGKRLMLFSGVHFNFSFDDEYLRALSGGEEFEGFKNKFYLRLYKQLCRYSWLVLLLTAASPIYDSSLDGDGLKGKAFSKYSSIRSGERGYWNSFIPLLRHDSLESFIESIRFYVDKGVLYSASELYLPVRIKPKGVNSLESFKNGISHIELRMLDIDPTQPLGVDKAALEFAHLLMIYLSALPDFEYDKDMQINAIKNHQNAALYDLSGVEIDGVPIITRAREIINDMIDFFAGNDRAKSLLDEQKRKLKHRLCERVSKLDIYR